MMREDRKRAEQRQKKIARRKREVQRMKRKLYKAGILAAAGIIVLVAILMLCGSGNAKKPAKKASSAKTKTETSEKTETKTPEEIEAEKIQEVLDSDQYKDQLGELYKKNPETKEIILNREKYSDDLLTWLFDHQEALQWVIDYPEQSARSEEELQCAGTSGGRFERLQNPEPYSGIFPVERSMGICILWFREYWNGWMRSDQPFHGGDRTHRQYFIYTEVCGRYECQYGILCR